MWDRSIRLVPAKSCGPPTSLLHRSQCLHAQVSMPEPMLLETPNIQGPEEFSAPTAAPGITWPSTPAAVPITPPATDEAIGGASTGAASPASLATANDAATPLPKTKNG